MVKQTNHQKDDPGKTTASVEVHQVIFPENLLCAQHYAGSVGNMEGITVMVQSPSSPAGL